MRKLYLAHSSLSRVEVRKWQKEVEKEIGIEFINPFHDFGDVESVKSVDEGRMTREEYVEHLNPAEIVENDCEAIIHSDGLVAIFDDTITYGTVMEVMVGCNCTDNPVFLIVTNGHHRNPWLRHHSDEIFISKEAFVEYMKGREVG